MITFCQIWQANNFHFFVSMYRVAVFVHLKNVAKLFFLACPFFGKSLFPKTRMSKKRTCACRFGPFWAILGRFMSHFWQKLFPENKKHRFLDMHRLHFTPKTRFYGIPQKGQKWFSENKNAPKRDMLQFALCAIAPRKNTKSFFMKIRMPQKGTLIICQNDNNIWQTLLKI